MLFGARSLTSGTAQMPDPGACQARSHPGEELASRGVMVAMSVSSASPENRMLSRTLHGRLVPAAAGVGHHDRDQPEVDRMPDGRRDADLQAPAGDGEGTDTKIS